MSSRLTEIQKWENKWFRKLSLEGKILFLYLCDRCDIAGFWEIDFERASFETGLPQNASGIFSQCTPKMKSVEDAFEEIEKAYLREGDVIWIRNFIFHQKNLPLNEKNNAHFGILKLIKSHNSFGQQVLNELNRQVDEKVFISEKRGAIEGLNSPIGKGKGKGKGNKGVQGETKDSDFGIFWKAYPRKTAIGAARKAWAKIKDAKALLPKMLAVIESQKKTDQWKKDAGQFIPHASTWLNQTRWEDEVTVVGKIKSEASPVNAAVCLIDKALAHRYELGTKREPLYLCIGCIRALESMGYKHWSGKTLAEIEKLVEQGKAKLNRKDSAA